MAAAPHTGDAGAFAGAYAGVAAGWRQAGGEDLETLREKARAQLEGEEGERSAVRLILRDGRRLEAALVSETATGVTVSIGGIERTFAQREIDRLVRLPPLADRYRAWRSQIDDGDVPQLTQFIDWLVGEELYHVALYEAALLLEQRPRDSRLRELHRRLRGQVRLFESRGQGRPADEDDRPEPMPLLGERAINLIRVYEIDLLDPPRLRIDRQTVLRFLSEYRGDERLPRTPEEREALLAAEPTRVLRLMFELQARELYGEVRVLEDPESVKRFRRDVTRWLVPGCATTRCHGGAEAGSLRLHARYATGTSAAYTNFLILSRATLADGTPLINTDKPEDSPLLHLGLRRSRSLFAHPPVPREDGSDAWRAVFPSPDDTRWRATTGWIRSLYTPRPDYPVAYPPADADADGNGDGDGPTDAESEPENGEPGGGG